MKGSDITFKGKTLEGKEISFCIVEFGNMYEGDDVVYVNSVPVLLSSIEIEDDEVAELKRKLAEVEGERDALLALNAEMLAALNGYAYGIKSCGHNFVCICNQVKAEAIIAKIEGREINPWLRNSPAK